MIALPKSNGCSQLSPSRQPGQSAGRLPLVVHQNFSDVDELTAVLNSQRHIQLTQLSLDSFNCELLFMEFSEAQFLFTKASCSVWAKGVKSADYLPFSIILQESSEKVVAHGHKVGYETLFGFDLNRPVDLILPAKTSHCGFLIKKDIFQTYLDMMDRADIEQRFGQDHFIVCPTTLEPLRDYLKQIAYLMAKQPQFLNQSHLKTLLLEDLVPLLINAIPPPGENLDLPQFCNRMNLVKQVEDYMMAHLDQPLTLKDLCQALHVSRRPLFYSFQEVFGVSPMAYLKVQRLQGVRRALKAADSDITVMVIAQRFGFWSAGHFSRDYKTMFGELPSETLRQ
jgi:AraC family transcriptional regulator, ethanolamine operon transcriptional activator